MSLKLSNALFAVDPTQETSMSERNEMSGYAKNVARTIEVIAPIAGTVAQEGTGLCLRTRKSLVR